MYGNPNLYPFQGFQFRSDNIRPYKPFRQTPPFKEKSVMLTSSDKPEMYTKLKWWIHSATFNFPHHAMFVGLYNGNGKAFCRLSHDELKGLIAFLQECEKEYNEVLPALQAGDVNVDQSINAYIKAQEAGKLIADAQRPDSLQ